MQFTSISEFFAMGGYGFYVWLSFGVSFVAIFLLIISSLKSHRTVFEQIQQRQRREKKLKKAAELASQAQEKE